MFIPIDFIVFTHFDFKASFKNSNLCMMYGMVYDESVFYL